MAHRAAACSLVRMARTITAPEPLNIDPSTPSVFLAGTIDLGNSENWQRRFASELDDLDVTLLNPRRTSWDGDPVPSNPTFVEQVTWELDAMERADVIAMYLAAGSLSPVSMMELDCMRAAGS